jgi:hypothetical protein
MERIGKIYQGNLKELNNNLDENLMFVVVRKIHLKEINKDVFEVLKLSENDKKFKFGARIIDENNKMLILQITNNFYLTEEELQKFQVINEIPIEDIEKILEIRKEYQNIEVSCEETRKEFEKIKDYHMRIFEILNYI